MRKLSSTFAIALLGTAALSTAAQADPYTASLEGCETAISERLGVESVSTSYNLEKIKSRSRYRDLSFIVSAHDDANAVQGVKVTCRARQNGEVLSLEFDDSTLPVSVARQ